MNIKGLELLIEMKLPVMRNTFLFRNLSEISPTHMNLYEENPKWIMRGFDYGACTIKDHPHIVNEARILGFRKSELEDTFNKINEELDRMGISAEQRKYFVAEVFQDEDVKFTGLGWESDSEVCVDFHDGNRPSRKDWIVQWGIEVPFIFGSKPTFSHAKKSDRGTANGTIYQYYSRKIIEDLKMLPKGTCVDFCGLNDGYFFYHDLCIPVTF